MHLPWICLIFYTICWLCICTLSAYSHSPSYYLIPTLFFFSLSKNLKQCFVENNAQLQKLYLSTRQKQVLFFIYTEIFYGSALLILKIYALHPLGKNTEDLKLDRCLDQRKITSYIMFRTIYLQICISYKLKHISCNHEDCAKEAAFFVFQKKYYLFALFLV